MSEGANNGPFKPGSPAAQFNAIVKGKVESNKTPSVSVIGVMDADQQIAVQNWLTEPETQSFIERLKETGRQTLAVVKEIEDYGDHKVVQYLDQHGMDMSFSYYSKDPEFAETPNGFQVGDIILTKFSHGLKMESVKTVKFPPKTENKVIKRFQEILNKKNREKDSFGKHLLGEEEKEE